MITTSTATLELRSGGAETLLDFKLNPHPQTKSLPSIPTRKTGQPKSVTLNLKFPAEAMGEVELVVWNGAETPSDLLMQWVRLLLKLR